MIKIEITGENFEAIQQQMLDMMPTQAVKTEPSVQYDLEAHIKQTEEVEDDGFVTVNVPKPEPKKEEKPKRTRRTKAQIEAEKAAQEEPEVVDAELVDDPRDACRTLLTQIEAKHKANGLVAASAAIKDVLEASGAEYDKVKMSNVPEGSLEELRDMLVNILEGDE